MKKLAIIGLTTILLFGVVGCDKKENKTEEEDIVITDGGKIKTCKGCVFAYYETEKAYGGNGDILEEEEYTDDYSKLKDENGKQRRRFVGHILDEEGRIIKAYACGIENDKSFCLEGLSSDLRYDINKEILLNVFGQDKCKDVNHGFACDDVISATANDGGTVTVKTNNYCSVNSNGKMKCFK